MGSCPAERGLARLHGRVGAALHNLDDTIASVRQLIADLRHLQDRRPAGLARPCH